MHINHFKGWRSAPPLGCKNVNMPPAVCSLPEMKRKGSAFARSLVFQQNNILGLTKLGPCVKFGKDRKAYADRDHLADGVEAGALIRADDSSA